MTRDMPKRAPALNTVSEVLNAYAERGIFREFGEKASGARTEYKFRWLTTVPIHLVHDRKANTLTFRNLLPNMPAKGDIYPALKKYLASRTDPKLLEHRRVDPKRMEVKTTNRGGTVTLTVKLKPRHQEYGTRKAINLVNEIFMSFLSGPYYDYMLENFGISEE